MRLKKFLNEISQSEFLKMIKKYDDEYLAYWSDKELDALGVNFKTTSKFQDQGILIYEPNDNVYVGRKTYKKRYK